MNPVNGLSSNLVFHEFFIIYSQKRGFFESVFQIVFWSYHLLLYDLIGW